MAVPAAAHPHAPRLAGFGNRRPAAVRRESVRSAAQALAIACILSAGSALTVGCGPPDCAAMPAGRDRDACYVEQAPRLFQADPGAATTAVERDVSDPNTRDLIWLEVTRSVDPRSVRYCQRIREPVIEERCRVFVSRPHLHPPGATGAPEGGGPPPSAPGG